MLKRAILLILAVLAADQALKFWVKLGFYYEESRPLFGQWGELHFIENPGMAFGMSFGGEWGKLMLTLFRIVAVAAIGYSLWRMTQRGARTGLLMSVALIFAGALGNIIDSTFYGLIFSESTGTRRAILFPPGGGYGTLLHGSVVDMLHFPIWRGRIPEWSPLWSGQYFEFFRPVFNLADAAITVGVILFILFQREKPKTTQQPVENTGPSAATMEKEPAPETAPPAP